MDYDREFTERKPSDFVLFGLAFASLIMSITGIVVGSPVLAFLTGFLMIFCVLLLK